MLKPINEGHHAAAGRQLQIRDSEGNEGLKLLGLYRVAGILEGRYNVCTMLGTPGFQYQVDDGIA